MKRKTDYMHYVTIIAIVAVVAVVLLVLNNQSSSVQVVDEEGNLVGEASRYQKFRKCPTCPPSLKDYEISAYAITGYEGKGFFKINGDSFTLVVGGENHNLAGGGVVGIDGTLYQAYAGGYKGVEWDLVEACSSDYALETYAVTGYEDKAYFGVVSVNTGLSPVVVEETFYLNVGKTMVLRDGAKIILKDILHQDYVAGYNGVTFELIC